jgi:hypothetical protein
MTYCTVEEVKELTQIRPDQLGLEAEDTDGLDKEEPDEALNALLAKWIGYCKSLIDGFCHQNFDDDVPGGVAVVCLRMVANMVALSQTRKNTPLIKVNDWKVGISSSAIFTNDLKRDLRDAGFVLDKSNKSDSVDFFAITGD